MPDIILALTDPQLARVRRAFRHLNADGSDAAVAQVHAWLVARLAQEVLRHETQVEGAAADAKARATLTAEGWAAA